MSAFEGGGRSWKSGHSNGGCVNFILQISFKCGHGVRGPKNPNILWTTYLEAPVPPPSNCSRLTGTIPWRGREKALRHAEKRRNSLSHPHQLDSSLPFENSRHWVVVGHTAKTVFNLVTANELGASSDGGEEIPSIYLC